MRSLRRKVARSQPFVLPTMKCDEGCGRCCGIIPVTEKEYTRIMLRADRDGVVPMAQGITCPFFQLGKCAVYEVRPLACRLFGQVDQMPCPFGYNTNVEDEIGRKLVRDNGKPAHVLHEALERSSLVPDWCEYVKKCIDEDKGDQP
jgi:hypothetical protein